MTIPTVTKPDGTYWLRHAQTPDGIKWGYQKIATSAATPSLQETNEEPLLQRFTAPHPVHTMVAAAQRTLGQAINCDILAHQPPAAEINTMTGVAGAVDGTDYRGYFAGNVNLATAHTLQTAVSKVLAKTIIQERTAMGDFRTWDDLQRRVQGLGNAKVSALQRKRFTLPEHMD